MKTEKTKKRLSKALAAAGFASRRACEELIFSGRVTVNGDPALFPQTLVDPNRDEIVVDGKKITNEENKKTFILNKPAGYVCSNIRRSKRTKLVIDLFKDESLRLFTVGRLDKETEGLILVTNDGHFANQVIHPSSNLEKEYVAKTNQEITDAHLKVISKGTRVEGSFIRPKRVVKIRKGTLKVVVKEGKKHEVRLLLEQAGLQVIHLKRTRIGGLLLNQLPVGTWREITEKEKEKIFKK